MEASDYIISVRPEPIRELFAEYLSERIDPETLTREEQEEYAWEFVCDYVIGDDSRSDAFDILCEA